MKVRCAAALLVVCGLASGATLPCAPGNLADYINLASDGCTLGNARVYDFLDLGPLGPATGLTADSVQVTPIGGSWSPGLLFAYQVSADPGDVLESRFSYTLETSSPSILAGLLEMSGSSVSPDGVNTVVEEFCYGEGFVADVCLAGGSDLALVFDIGSDADYSERVTLPALSRVGLLKDVVIDGGTSGSASLGIVRNQFSLVPEPSTVLSFASVLLVCAGLQISRRRAGGGKS